MPEYPGGHDPSAHGSAAPHTPRASLRSRIESDFRYHAPKEGQPELYTEVRTRARELALFLEQTVPPGRELSTALTKLEECVMHANAGIARHG